MDENVENSIEGEMNVKLKHKQLQDDEIRDAEMKSRKAWWKFSLIFENFWDIWKSVWAWLVWPFCEPAGALRVFFLTRES